MERSDNTVRSGDDGIAIASTRYPTSARLVAAIRREDPNAMRELFLLHAPLLRDQARLMGVDRDNEDEFVTTFLDDFVLNLLATTVVPRDLTRYLVASLRNRARNLHRDRKRHEASRDAAYSHPGGGQQRVVAEAHSEYGIRASGVETDAPGLRAAIAKLAEWSAAELSPEDLELMIVVGRHMPLREFAQQIGISYANARVRLHRLRARFTKLTLQYVETLTGTERQEIEGFLRRAGIRLHTTRGNTRSASASAPHHEETGNDET